MPLVNDCVDSIGPSKVYSALFVRVDDNGVLQLCLALFVRVDDNVLFMFLSRFAEDNDHDSFNVLSMLLICAIQRYNAELCIYHKLNKRVLSC